MLDAVIIGGGVAGLYAARRLRSTLPAGARIAILEKGDAIGGRLIEVPFGGTLVPAGAGIARQRKDTTLLRLAAALRVPTNPFRIQHAYSPQVVGHGVVSKSLPRLRRRAALASHSTTFRAFAIRALGRAGYDAFVQATGYSDYESADAYDTLRSYGLEDNADGWTGVSVPWNRLAHALARGLDVRLRAEVTHIGTLGDGAAVEVFLRNRASPLRCRVVILATDVMGLRALLPNHTPRFWSQIIAQPFVRTYAVVSRESRDAVARAAPRYTVVPAPLQKVIPMDPSRGVYMIAYADNASAESVHRLRDDPRAFEKLLADALGVPRSAVKLEKVQTFYWRAGTHAYAPLPPPYKTRAAFLRAAQHPEPRVFVVGEAVAQRQGWVQGALESVDAVLSEVVVASSSS